MDEDAYTVVLDRVISNVARRGAFKAIEIQTRIDTFITIAGQQFDEADIANVLAGAATTTAIQAEIDAIRRALIRALKDAVIETAQTARETRQKLDSPNGLYTWQTNSGNPCPDCQNRSGQTHTMEYWDAVGTPGTGITVCGNKCKCTLNETAASR